MKDGSVLHAKQINHGRSEVWLEADGKELTRRRNLATNEIVNVARRFCSPEVFEAFYKELVRSIGNVAKLDLPNLDEVAAELRLEPSV